MITYSQVEDAEQALRALREAYLRRWGWTITCNTPGSFWLWKRDFADVDARMTKIREERKLPSLHAPYGVITADTDLAVTMTLRVLDERPELDDDKES